MDRPVRPAPARIDDWSEPEFPAEVQAAFDAAAPFAEQLLLDPDVLCAEAARRSGLDDFGDDWFREPLAVFCRALRDEAGLSAFGHVSSWEQVVGWLVNRLRLADLLRRHPEIHEVELAPPLVICGQPRTGTTHLHNLLAADTRWRTLPYWEAVEPVLSATDAAAVAAGSPDPRLARAEAGLGFLNAAAPLFPRMHEMTTHHVHEEIALLALDFCSQQLEALALMPSYRDWYLGADQHHAYRSLRTTLQALTWLRPELGNRWVLKSPQHTEWFVPLADVFADATFVVTHRDPVAVTASVCTMLAYLARLRVERPDPVRYGRYWADRMVQMFTSVVRDRDRFDPSRSVDVYFDEFMADDVATARRIYDVAGISWTDDAAAAMASFMDANPRGRHGTVEYDLAALGLERDSLAHEMAFYGERFAVDGA